MKEIKKERGKTYKVFRKDSGHKRYEIRCKPIHYQDNDSWEDIDVSLSLSPNIEKEYPEYLALKNTFTLGFRGDKKSKKFSGIRYKGSPDFQYEFTPIKIQFDSGVILISEEFLDVRLNNPYTIEHGIDSETSLLTKTHEAYTQSLVKTSRDIGSFKILEQLELTGITILNSFRETQIGKVYLPTEENEFIFTVNEDEKIRIPQPKMWNKQGKISEGVGHSLFEENGILYYEKISTEEGEEWLKEQSGILFIDETSYYAETSDGYSFSKNAVWATARTTSTIEGKSNTTTNYEATADASLYLGNYYGGRGWFWFDTSAIDDAATVGTAILNIYGILNNDSDVCAMLSTQNDTYTSWTNNAFSGNEYGHVTWGTGQYNQITFNATGKGDVNKTGDTKVCLREYTYDYLDSTPTSTVENGSYFAEETGTDKDPFLSIDLIQELEDTVSDIATGTPTSTPEFILTASTSGTHTPTLLGLDFGVTKTIVESSTPTILNIFTLLATISDAAIGTPTLLKVMNFLKTLSDTEISSLSTVSQFLLEESLTGTFTPTSFDAYVDSASITGTITPTLIDIFNFYLTMPFQTAVVPTAPIKFIFDNVTLTLSQNLAAQDIFTLIATISDTVTDTLSTIFKFVLEPVGTAIIGDVSAVVSEGTYDTVSFSGQGTPIVSDATNFTPIVTVTATADNLSVAVKLFLTLVSESMIGVLSVIPLNTAIVVATMTGVSSKTTAWTTTQSFTQSSVFTVLDFIQYLKTIESSATGTPSITKALNFLSTLSKETSIDTTVSTVQTLLAVPTKTISGTVSAETQFILDVAFAEQSVFSEIVKFLITAVLTNEITSTISGGFVFEDSVSVAIEGVPLISFLEVILGKLSLVLEDSATISMILEDVQLKGMVLEDEPVSTLTLEDE